MRKALLLSCVLFGLHALGACADSSSTVWKFAKGADYEQPTAPVAAPSFTSLSMAGDALKLSATCSIHLNKQPYYPGGPFQMLLKSGESAASIGKFMAKSLKFDLNGSIAYYQADPNDCNTLGTNFLASDSQLIAIRGGSIFYAFARQGDAVGAASQVQVPTNGAELKTSKLPFAMADYSAHCTPAMAKGVPQASAKCGPSYNYHVASRDSADPLSKLVGSHDYQKGGAGSAGADYNNPVGHNFHPVFLVFPPMGDVTVVRVDDFEGRQEKREAISGAYLVVKDGRVTDELNEGCDLDVRYVCSGDDGRKFKLTNAGKFEPVK